MILAIEAAVAGGSLSLLSEGSTIAAWAGDSNVSRAEELLPAIATMMAETKFSKADISMIAVAAGPGSFTGIRIGLSTALGLAAGLAVAHASVSLLEAMAGAVPAGGPCLVAIPMGRSSICIQHFEKGSPTSEPQTITEPEFTNITSRSSKTIVIHEALAMHCVDAGDVVNLGSNLSQFVGVFSTAHPSHTEDPLFITKSF